MTITIPGRYILGFLQVISWIIFLGLCVEAGGLLVNTIITLFIRPAGVHNFWEGADYLSGLHQLDRGHFAVVTLLMVIVAVLKALLFYLIIRLFHNKALSFSRPFQVEIRQCILTIAYLSLGIGLFAHWAQRYTGWLTGQGTATPDLQKLHIAGADVWLFMAVILFVIAQVVKRGIEMQTENDLTV